MVDTKKRAVIVPRADAAAAIDETPTALPLSVVMTDLDGFGALNDAHGREAGDAVLIEFQQALKQNLPKGALVHRIGGDEWCIALPGSSLENSLVLLEELRSHLDAAQLGVGDEIVTLSAGLAARPPHGSTGDELMRAADSALSRCKRSGRNQVGIFIEDKMVMKSNYYSRATLDRLSALSRATNRTEASLLREAADMLLSQYASET